MRAGGVSADDLPAAPVGLGIALSLLHDCCHSKVRQNHVPTPLYQHILGLHHTSTACCFTRIVVSLRYLAIDQSADPLPSLM